MESYLKKICTLEEAKINCDALKNSGKRRIVFTNGCFDILHPGHARYLSSARDLGDYLIVALNSDRSVRSIKGTKRPIFPEKMRAELLAALECVDSVLIFDEENPLRVIKSLLPHILVKGGDWQKNQIIGADVVKATGGQVRRIPFVTGYSTTSIIDKIVRQYT
ncbi:MAG: D-glycero-beta-D-manno-heptose 1-phosphate adenylyltransferase [Deltaproteobacteria bacterium]|nr:D-glycero-beta-D-manno-heptose 1-phosphate adenylyltransferase [Deltaproteobacteria bacterium]